MVRVDVEWSSSHDIEPPEGETAEAFEERLHEGEESAWDHALKQCYSNTAELMNWKVV